MTTPPSVPLVLVVEDDVDIAMLVRHVLEDADCAVLHAHDGEQAIEISGKNRVDLVLLDMRLPQMSGEEVAAGLRQNPDAPPIVVFSASADLATIAARIGAVAYIHKPFDLDDLADTVQRALAGSAAQSA